jgi:hypothetical protein
MERCPCPLRSADGEDVVIDQERRATRYLQNVLPDGWNEAVEAAERLAEQMRYLPWSDRARLFDGFFWAEAKRRLTNADVTAIVNRQPSSLAHPVRVDDYLRFCRATVTAVLLLVNDPLRVNDEAAALAHFLSSDRDHQEAAVSWIGDGHEALLARCLPGWPGCAFLLLILSPSDSAESFLARDAFWAAMLGRA